MLRIDHECGCGIFPLQIEGPVLVETFALYALFVPVKNKVDPSPSSEKPFTAVSFAKNKIGVEGVKGVEVELEIGFGRWWWCWC
ncbi:hypothetical protein VNO77_45146 [Canavalia gladiata]|uniref:Uncharacterized protein n=1 Tax=Canavalia gladiata TaxID=3824 RepID=A0AAN9PNB8_CANGL